MPRYTFQESIVRDTRIVDPKGKKRVVTAKHESGARTRLPKRHVGGWVLVLKEPDPLPREEWQEPILIAGQFTISLPATGAIPIKDRNKVKIGEGVVTEDGLFHGQIDMTMAEGQRFHREVLYSPPHFSIGMQIEQSRPLPAVLREPNA